VGVIGRTLRQARRRYIQAREKQEKRRVMRDQPTLHEAAETTEAKSLWWVAIASLLLIFISWGAPYVVAVALKPMAADLGAERSVPSLASALAYIGSGVGGIARGWGADRAGAMWTALFGSLMVGLGAIVASGGTEWQLYIGYGVMIGLLGNAGIFAPLMANTSRLFTRKRGTALALVASGQQVAGAVWPPVFRYGIDAVGWRGTLFWYGIFVLVAMPPLCLMLRRRPAALPVADKFASSGPSARPLGLTPNLLQALLCVAIVCCCVAMAMPMSHVVAFCSDLGYAPARGAEMLSLLLAAAFMSRMIWGRLSDRIGGLRTVLISSFAQAVFLSLYLVVDNLIGLYVLSAAFGLGFGGIIPSYVLAVRELLPAREVGWRTGTVLLFGLTGMALGGWLGGYLYDWFGFYQPAFAVGVAFNLANLALIGGLVMLSATPRRPRGFAPAL
jgi:MFS family permease